MSSNEKFEREFTDFLAEEDSRLAALYRKLPQMEPDPRLDGAVRAMAHRALNPQQVATPQAGSQKRRRGHWLPALGAAAGVVFAAGIAFRLGPSWHGDRGETGAPASDVISVRSVDAPPPIAAPLSQAPPPVESSAAPAGAASTSATSKLKVQAETEAAKPASDAEVLKKASRLDDGADNRPAAAGGLGKAEKPAAAATQPQAFPAPAPAARKRASELDAVERKQIMATGAGQNLHDRDTGKPRASAAQAAPPVSDKRAATVPKPAEPQRQEELRAASPPVQDNAEAPSKPAQASPPPAPSAPEHFAPSAPRALAPAAGAPAKTDAQATAGPARDEVVSPALSGQAAQKKENEKIRSKDSNASLYPEHWLENIRVMLRDNRRDDAVRSLGEFRKMYPDYKLPDDLRDLK
jgi:hypothetical protein